ncbi:MAG: Sapep family Mn(2+)-dependent dipeptidase [Atopobiaceae bacterium]|nr:Sapep family Mn(2+)-dependent dipeptidase [Atopobiaceae bacterium]
MDHLVQKAQEYVDEVWEDLVADIGRLVAIESVEDLGQAKPNAPFGPGPRAALDEALAMAGRLGLDAHDCEGYLGYADVAGASDKQIATIAHVDVVPAVAGDWTGHPYVMDRRDGYLIGRGVIDDKGPFVLSLYTARFLKERAEETGKPLPYTLRCIIGANEETGMSDVDYYLERYPQPAFCFTPDAEFPVIHGEKGIYHGYIYSAPITDGVIESIEGGTVPNAVPGRVAAIVRYEGPELPEAPSITLTTLDDKRIRIEAVGKGGHASMPEDTVNAIAILVDYLLDHELCNADEKAFLEFERQLLPHTDGSGVGLAATDDKFGPLTCVGGVIAGGTARPEDSRIVQSLDCRYPTTTSGDKITKTIASLVEPFGGSITCTHDMVPFYTEPTSPEIATLVDTYNEIAGTNDQAFTIGGGTYARHFANACAFGPNVPMDQLPDWVGPEHGADEGVSEDQLKLALKVYIVAISRLMELDL